MTKKRVPIPAIICLSILFLIFLNQGFIPNAFFIFYCIFSSLIDDACKVVTDRSKMYGWKIIELILGISLCYYFYKIDEILLLILTVVLIVIMGLISILSVAKSTSQKSHSE